MASSMHRLANPLRFQKIADAVYPWVLAPGVLAPVGLWWALVVAPADYQQGDAYRIIFVHGPPPGWRCSAICSSPSAVWRPDRRHPLAEVAAGRGADRRLLHRHRSLNRQHLGQADVGHLWVWDARLTSVLILFFLYLGYIALYDAFDDPARGARAASILALVGVVNLPIIKFSVDWWNTLHQPATVLRVGGPAIAPAMLWPLLTMALVFKLYFVAVLLLRMRAELTGRRIANLRLSQAAGTLTPYAVHAGRDFDLGSGTMWHCS